METYDELIKTWKFNQELFDNQKYLSNVDSTFFMEHQKYLTGINLHIPPQPFWGNIMNPSVIVLFNNPNIIDTSDNEYAKGLLDNLKGIKKFDFLDRQNGQYKWSHFDAIYWQRRFSDIKEDLSKAENPIINYNDYIGEFEFHGYNSSSFRKFNHFLPTQMAMFNHIKYLIKEYQPIIVIARGKRHWLDALDLIEDNEHIVIVRSPQSAYLSKRTSNRGNIDEQDFNKIISRIKKDALKTKTDKS